MSNEVFKAVGRVNQLSIMTIDAYGVAVKNGFEGTVDEWLASLHATDEQVESAVLKYMIANNIGTGSTATIGTVELLANKWTGSDNLYSQVISVEGVTENSQVDLTPSVEQLVAFYQKDLALVAENEDGVVTVYAIGQKPTNDYMMQVTITEVIV
jgi:hypothetical protein